MPGRWIDHATDPLEPWEFDDEDFPEEWKYSKGHFAEVLLHHKSHKSTSSGIYYVEEVYSRSKRSPGNYISARALAHSEDAMHRLDQDASGATGQTIGRQVLLHWCDGPSCECVATRRNEAVFHVDAFRTLRHEDLTARGLEKDTTSEAVVMWGAVERKVTERVQNLDLSWLKPKLPLVKARLAD